MSKNNYKVLENILFTRAEAEAFVKNKYFGSAARLLLENQKVTWQQLADGYDSLSSVQIKTFNFDGFKLNVQFNPGRIISSSAKVDAKSLKKRKCFLCYENLPGEQKGILYGQEYLILCNPFPIFPEHYTLPNINHFPQRIKDSFSSLLEFSKDLSNYYTVFYNGPGCGASAPDHLHFQAGSKFFMPVEDEYFNLKTGYGEILLEGDELRAYGVDDGLRRFISIEGINEKRIARVFNKFYNVYETLMKNNNEPMMNIISSFEKEKGWRIIIFLRQKHRPHHYFAEGEKNILLSPAAVDLGGVCITPLEKDFNKITKENLNEIFREITIGKEYFDYVKISLSRQLKEKMKDG